jgi:hypothetical protein
VVGTKGERGLPGLPGPCSCNSISVKSPQLDEHSSRSDYAKVPAVSRQHK